MEQRGRVRDLLEGEVQTHEPAHRIGVVDRVLDPSSDSENHTWSRNIRSIVATGLAF